MDNIEQINASCEYLSSYLPENLQEKFAIKLQQQMIISFKNCWFPNSPIRGSAQRSVQIIDNYPSKLLRNVLVELDISFNHFPSDLSVWIDPDCVSYRIENSYIQTIWTIDQKDDQVEEFEMPKYNAMPIRKPATLSPPPIVHKNAAISNNGNQRISVA